MQTEKNIREIKSNTICQDRPLCSPESHECCRNCDCKSYVLVHVPLGWRGKDTLVSTGIYICLLMECPGIPRFYSSVNFRKWYIGRLWFLKRFPYVQISRLLTYKKVGNNIYWVIIIPDPLLTIYVMLLYYIISYYIVYYAVILHWISIK